MTRNTDLGQILVDTQGRTLYLFAKDTGATSTCDGSCASYWPPVPVTGVPHAAGGASATSLGVITRADGAQELSYAGHPLYYFIGDTKAGQQHGQGVDQFGAKWYVLDATGTAVVQQPSNTGNTGGGGYGYSTETTKAGPCLAQARSGPLLRYGGETISGLQISARRHLVSARKGSACIHRCLHSPGRRPNAWNTATSRTPDLQPNLEPRRSPRPLRCVRAQMLAEDPEVPTARAIPSVW